MTSPCLACLGEKPDLDGYHRRCLKELFGTARVPEIDLELAKLHTVALAMVGKTSLSGIQRKISLSLSVERTRLHLGVGAGHYILKPQAATFPQLAENEQVSTLIAKEAGIEVSPFGLIKLKDGSLAYIVRRFDRDPQGHKRRQEDFCQLTEKPPKDKYDGSAELCARVVERFASEPLVELVKLFRRMVFTWWSGNGDMHLKNFSLLADPPSIERLSPAYDLLCTRLVIPDDLMALPVSGKNNRLRRKDWLGYADYCGIPERVALEVMAEIARSTEIAQGHIERSFLTSESKQVYKNLIRERTAELAHS